MEKKRNRPKTLSIHENKNKHLENGNGILIKTKIKIIKRKS